MDDNERQEENENRIERRQDSQRKLAWVAMITMIGFTIFLFIPIIPESRIEILVEVATLFYISQAGVVSAYMGSEAFVNRSRSESTTTRTRNGTTTNRSQSSVGRS